LKKTKSPLKLHLKIEELIDLTALGPFVNNNRLDLVGEVEVEIQNEREHEEKE